MKFVFNLKILTHYIHTEDRGLPITKPSAQVSQKVGAVVHNIFFIIREQL